MDDSILHHFASLDSNLKLPTKTKSHLSMAHNIYSRVTKGVIVRLNLRRIAASSADDHSVFLASMEPDASSDESTQ